MTKNLLRFLVISALSLSSHTADAQGSDFQCTPTDLGLIAFAPPCSTGTGFTTGTILTQAGSTMGATPDTTSGHMTSCYSGAAPLKDVWYVFTASETHVQINIQGVGPTPLTDSYVGIYQALTDECLGLIPRECSVGSGTGLHSMEFGPLTLGVRYYLQIASTSPTGSGAYTMTINSKNICSDCSKNSLLNCYPLPVNAAYPPDTTVGFCFSVIGYNELFGNRLHGVVPLLGSGWDATTLTVYDAADSADFLGQWKWFNNLDLGPSGIVSGFFYDVGGDNDPRNNLGDNGTYTTVWTFCFTVKTQTAALCASGQTDLSIRFLTFADGESGSLVASYDCSGDEDYVFDAHMECCPKPYAAIPFAAGCNNTPDGSILAYAGFSFFGYNYYLYNSDGVLIQTFTGPAASTTPYTFGGLLEGNYYLFTEENSAGACMTGVNVYVPGPVDYDVQQLTFGCPSGTSICSNTAAVVVNSGMVSSITWSNGDTGFIADSLCTGWTYVTIVDTGTVACVIVDSIYIVNLPAGSPLFDYGAASYCTSDSAIFLSDFPTASGGTFILQTQPGGMTGADINPTSGTVDISGATSPGYVIVKYTSPPPCNYQSADTFYVQPSPPAPLISDFPCQYLCVGDVANSYFNPLSMDVLWYADSALTSLVTTQNPGSTFDFFSGAVQALPNVYDFYLTTINTTTSCRSKPIHLVIMVYPLPNIDAGPPITSCPGYGVTLNCSGANSFVWSPPGAVDDPTAANPVATLTTTTLFTVVGTDATSGCSSTDTVTVFVSENGNCDVIIYNGFTPNGDNNNDYWHIDGIFVDPKNQVKIFNRWGEKIWEAVGYDNRQNRWEGRTTQGKDAPSGTYFYVIHFKGEAKTGYVELTR